MKKLLNTLYVTSDDSYLSLDGENIVVLDKEREIGRLPLHNLEGIVSFGYRGTSPALMGGMWGGVRPVRGPPGPPPPSSAVTGDARPRPSGRPAGNDSRGGGGARRWPRKVRPPLGTGGGGGGGGGGGRGGARRRAATPISLVSRVGLCCRPKMESRPGPGGEAGKSGSRHPAGLGRGGRGGHRGPPLPAPGPGTIGGGWLRGPRPALQGALATSAGEMGRCRPRGCAPRPAGLDSCGRVFADAGGTPQSSRQGRKPVRRGLIEARTSPAPSARLPCGRPSPAPSAASRRLTSPPSRAHPPGGPPQPPSAERPALIPDTRARESGN